MKCNQLWCAVGLVCALPLVADAATRFVAHTGSDGPDCGSTAATACRSISRAIALAAPGDTILVGPGRYGDLNRNGVLGDTPGEETGSPGCSCVLSMNKSVVVLSSAGAAVTIIEGISMNVVQTVVVLSDGEFGRPGKGFTVTETGRRASQAGFDFNGHGIGIDAANVKVRGNQVVFSRSGFVSSGIGIFTVSSAPVRIEGNQVLRWGTGIEVRRAGGAIVSKNQVIGNHSYGIVARGGSVVGNVLTANENGLLVFGDTTVSGNVASMNLGGFHVANGFTGVLTKNNIFLNHSCGLLNTVSGLDATNNYWGVPTGPGVAPPSDDVCNVPGATATTSPFATEPFKVQILKP